MVSYPLASSLTPLASVFKSSAIWSIKAPVPPAHVPFMRCSRASPKKVILASSPPSSMTTSVSGIKCSTVVVAAITSCTNGILATSANPMPPEPVMAILTVWSPISEMASFKTLMVAVLTSEKCRS